MINPRRCWGVLPFVVFAIAATPASATLIQTETGAPYTGTLSGVLSPGTKAVFKTSPGVVGFEGTIICDVSTATGQITNAGSFGNPATGDISAILWKTVGANTCPGDIANAANFRFQALALPWRAETRWLSDNTTGARNGTDTLGGVRMLSTSDTLLGPLSCQYVGDLGNANPPSTLAQGDLFNPDNTASGKTEMRFVNEPFIKVSTESLLCPPIATLTATYVMAGQGDIELEIREADPPSPPTTPPASPPAGGTAGLTAAPPKKCKKGKKGVASKKGCKKKRK